MELNKLLVKYGEKYAFGKYVKHRRLELKLTICDLAEKVAISPAYLCDIENGNRIAPKKVLTDLKKELKILPEHELDFEDLAYMTHETCSPDLIQYLIASKEARSALRHIIENNVSGREFLEVVINNVKNIEK